MRASTDPNSPNMGDAPRADFPSGDWPAKARETLHPDIKIARTHTEMEAIGRLRYELYIERDLKAYDGADHEHRTLLESIDAKSLNFQCYHDGQLLAAVRLARAVDALADRHQSLFVEAAEIERPDLTVVSSRLAMRSSMRARSMIVLLFQEVYRSGLEAGARYCLLGTRSDLIGLFERFGCVRTGHGFRDPVANYLHVLQFDLHDFDHLRSKQSPFLAVTDAWLKQHVEDASQNDNRICTGVGA